MTSDSRRPDPQHDLEPDAAPGDEEEFRNETLEGDEFTSDIDAGEAEADVKSGASDGEAGAGSGDGGSGD